MTFSSQNYCSNMFPTKGEHKEISNKVGVYFNKRFLVNNIFVKRCGWVKIHILRVYVSYTMPPH